MRESAADSIVLLKNDKNVLPLTVDSKIKSIAVIGPNAKYAFSSGGGSARLLESYTVTPLQAIQAVSEKRGLDVKFALGTTTHKLNPLLDPYITLPDGTGSGALLEFWNEIPANGFATANSKLTDDLKPCTWSCTTKVSNCVLLDGVVSFNFPKVLSLTESISVRMTPKSKRIVSSEYKSLRLHLPKVF